MTIESKKIFVKGIVQGVGFRPFVYQLATTYQLKGQVANTSQGVNIYLEGPDERIEAFRKDLIQKKPPLSQINDVLVETTRLKNYPDFSITASQSDGSRFTLISPDVSICDDCRDELFDPLDRRYHYPFINCTNCGPRYTIIEDIPYDRPNTSMRHFTMCEACQAEYEDPLNRRFHAQPNACPVCGPHVALHDHKGNRISKKNPLAETIALLKDGRILAIKGLGGFHLVVDAENRQAVSTLRRRKHREQKPLALMSYDIETVEQYAVVSTAEADLLQSRQRPIVLLQKKKNHLIAPDVSPKNRYFGVMIPYTPLHYLLLENEFLALVMTSGNLSEEPIAIDNGDAFRRLKDIVDYFLIHDRNIYLRSDDSVVKKVGPDVRFFRRSRGYVPVPVFLKKSILPILACGAELKNTVCLTKGKHAFVSQHIGDLENLSTYEFFKKTIAHLERILDVEPQIIAHDRHPDYLSTQYAKEQKHIDKTAVQHHHAHIASCMAENQIEDPVIGLSCDGTGYGLDGNIWGGEIMIAHPDRFERAGHLAYVPMPGGAAAIKEPWRMAVSYLYQAYGRQLFNLDLPLLKAIDRKKIDIIIEMIDKHINSPLTSSLGRLFDGVAAIAGIRSQVAFEGQAAMELEMAAANLDEDSYEYFWGDEDVLKVDPQPIIAGVARDVEQGVSTSRVSGKYHATLIRMFAEICESMKKKTRISRVALSGGCFQNSILLSGLSKQLESKGFEVLTHKKVPANDGGIALGQAVIADAVSSK